jgi:hypothetical protein
MPGHMNVLLAEADVPYDRIIDMDDINSDFAQADVALVVAAARTVMVIKAGDERGLRRCRQRTLLPGEDTHAFRRRQGGRNQTVAVFRHHDRPRSQRIAEAIGCPMAKEEADSAACDSGPLHGGSSWSGPRVSSVRFRRRCVRRRRAGARRVRSSPGRWPGRRSLRRSPRPSRDVRPVSWRPVE